MTDTKAVTKNEQYIEGWVEQRVHPIKGHPICGAKTRSINRFGEQVCTQSRVKGKERCRRHGGNAVSGPNHYRYKTGKYSKYNNVLGGKLLERYQEALNNPDILALNDEIALLDMRIGELLGGVRDGQSGKLWSDLQAANRQLQAARGDGAAMAYWMNEISQLINRGSSVAASWNEMGGLFERRRRLVETERKRREAMQNYATAEQQMVLVQTLAQLVNEHVTDPAERKAITNGLIRELSPRPGTPD